jgi:hypothetical protein
MQPLDQQEVVFGDFPFHAEYAVDGRMWGGVRQQAVLVELFLGDLAAEAPVAAREREVSP